MRNFAGMRERLAVTGTAVTAPQDAPAETPRADSKAKPDGGEAESKTGRKR